MGRMDSPSEDAVIAYGGIADFSKSGLRSSARIRAQPNGDAPQLERAMELIQRRDHSSPRGNSCVKKLSFVDFPDSEIERRASVLGVSLGESSKDVKNSIASIKELERSRNLVFLNNNLPEVDEGSSSLILTNASNLSEDLVNDEGRVHNDQEGLVHFPLKAKTLKVKLSADRRVVRRSARLSKLRNQRR